MSTGERAGRDPSRKKEARQEALGGRAWPPVLSLPFSLQEALTFLSLFGSLSLYHSIALDRMWNTRQGKWMTS